jgi:hypothetical protein
MPQPYRGQVLEHLGLVAGIESNIEETLTLYVPAFQTTAWDTPLGACRRDTRGRRTRDLCHRRGRRHRLHRHRLNRRRQRRRLIVPSKLLYFNVKGYGALGNSEFI